MKTYIITIENIKTSNELIVRSKGIDETTAKEYARMFLNGNCRFKYIKCIGDDK